jgi:hypothetical protein
VIDDKTLDEWERDAMNGLAHAHGVVFTEEVSLYIVTLQFRMKYLITELRRVRSKNILSLEEDVSDWYETAMTYKGQLEAERKRSEILRERIRVEVQHAHDCLKAIAEEHPRPQFVGIIFALVKALEAASESKK